MNKVLVKWCGLALLGGLVSTGTAYAQYFSYNVTGDALLGFRKTGTHQGNYELVVNLGNITNYINLSGGTTINVTNYTPSVLTDSFANGYQNLQWSVSAAVPFPMTLGPFPSKTIWYTLPAPNTNTQSTVPDRYSGNQQNVVQKRIQGLGQGASVISGNLGSTNADNNTMLVREPWDATSLNSLTYYIGDASDSTLGDFGGAVINVSVENVIPSTFNTPARLDLYQSVPSGLLDPISGSTGPSSYFVGYFILAVNGTMTFTRASTATPTPPPPVIVSISRAANVSTVYFTTTNGANYTLFYTNESGLTTPVTNWPTASSLVGNGGTNSLSDTTTDGARFYRVGAH
jgi:hypothetical protein